MAAATPPASRLSVPGSGTGIGANAKLGLAAKVNKATALTRGNNRRILITPDWEMPWLRSTRKTRTTNPTLSHNQVNSAESSSANQVTAGNM
jgi:hypothetical protein